MPINEHKFSSILNKKTGATSNSSSRSSRMRAIKKNVSFADNLVQVNQYYDATYERLLKSNKLMSVRDVVDYEEEKGGDRLGGINHERAKQLGHGKATRRDDEKEAGVKSLFLSYKFNVVILVLVVLLMLCVTGELLMRAIELENYNRKLTQNIVQLNAPSINSNLNLTTTTTTAKSILIESMRAPIEFNRRKRVKLSKLMSNASNSSSSSSDFQPSKPNNTNNNNKSSGSLTSPYKIMAEVFKYTGLLVLSMFITEFMIKLILFASIFFEYKMELAELVIIVTTFVFDIVLIEREFIFHTIIGLGAIIR